MKKLVTMVAVLGVLAFCLPSYGEILVYKVAITGKAVYYEEDEGGYGIGSGTIRGYWVADVNFADAEYPNVDANDALIVYGKDDEGEKVWEDVGSVGEYNQWAIGSSWAVGVDIVDEYVQIEGCAIGKAKKIDIGAADKQIVATSLTGHGILWGDPLYGTELFGSGTISAKLDSRRTKEANAARKTFAEVVGEIEDYLSPPEPPELP